MSRTTGSTAAQTEARIAEALQGLQDGLTRATIVQELATKHRVTPRTARRWVQAALCDYFDAPMTDVELSFGVSSAIERLELIADRSRHEGEVKLEIAAVKAAASIASQRLAGAERYRLQGQRLGVRSSK